MINKYLTSKSCFITFSFNFCFIVSAVCFIGIIISTKTYQSKERGSCFILNTNFSYIPYGTYPCSYKNSQLECNEGCYYLYWFVNATFDLNIYLSPAQLNFNGDYSVSDATYYMKYTVNNTFTCYRYDDTIFWKPKEITVPYIFSSILISICMICFICIFIVVILKVKKCLCSNSMNAESKNPIHYIEIKDIT
jgi:hypothetical protein